MAIPGYLWITDEQGHALTGPVKVKGREHSIEIYSFTHEVRIPTDPDTGALTSTRKHEPFIFTKEFDATTPLLNKACTSGKTLQSARLSWYRINDKGQEEEYFRQTLAHVKIISVKPIVYDIKEKNKERYGHLEQVSLRYEKIQWEYLEGNIKTQDIWTER